MGAGGPGGPGCGGCSGARLVTSGVRALCWALRGATGLTELDLGGNLVWPDGEGGDCCTGPGHGPAGGGGGGGGGGGIRA